jgi:hypothetical protein
MNGTNAGTHWENIYATKAPEALSWLQPHLERSLSLIERAAGNRGAPIIDVGGGESTLVDDLLSRGYGNITILDISQTALAVAKKRLGRGAEAGFEAISPKFPCNRSVMKSGTIGRCFTFLRNRNNASRMSRRCCKP